MFYLGEMIYVGEMCYVGEMLMRCDMLVRCDMLHCCHDSVMVDQTTHELDQYYTLLITSNLRCFSLFLKTEFYRFGVCGIFFNRTKFSSCSYYIILIIQDQ